MLVDRAGDAQRIGNQLFFSRGDAIFMADLDPQTHAMLDAGQSIQNGLYTDYGAHGSFDITDSGTLLYKPGGTQAGNRRLMMNTGQGAKATGFPAAAYDNMLTVSGDGSHLCVTRLRDDGMWEIWGGTTDPPRLRRMVWATDMDFAFARLSDDGTILSFARIASDQDGVQVDVLVQPFNGSSPATLVIEDLKLDSYRVSGFSPDNKRVVADVPDPATPGQRKVVELDIATGEETDLLTRAGGAAGGMWSPNGDLLCFKTLETGEQELHVFDPQDGSTMRASPMPANAYHWIETIDDGESLLFWDRDDQGWTVTVARDDTGTLRIGEPVSTHWVRSEDAIAFAIDNHGGVYTIEPGVNDGVPNHLVVIEHWLESVLPGSN
jgi:Tol biopolymer transport system component